MISILMPVYNESLYLEKAVRSILEQPYKDIELLIVNDGSSDNTWEKMLLLQQTDTRIKIFNPGKLGKNGSFNHAFEKSSGEWIGLLAGDDLCGDMFFQNSAEVASHFMPLQKKVFIGGYQYSFSDSEAYSSENNVIWKPPLKSAPLSNTLGIVSRALAQMVFPLPLNYPNEDTWTALCYRYFADERLELDCAYTKYRIHSNNSYDHNGDFAVYNEAYHIRRLAIKEFCDRYVEQLKPEQYNLLLGLYKMEQLRYTGKTIKILFIAHVPFIEKVKAVFFSNALLNNFKVKTTSVWSKIRH